MPWLEVIGSLQGTCAGEASALRLGIKDEVEGEGAFTTPAGRVLSNHYLTESGPERNIPGSVVDHVVDTVAGVAGRNETTVYYDTENDLTVVTGRGGKIVTAHRGKPGRSELP
jgi:hypothetical protein